MSWLNKFLYWWYDNVIYYIYSLKTSETKAFFAKLSVMEAKYEIFFIKYFLQSRHYWPRHVTFSPNIEVTVGRILYGGLLGELSCSEFSSFHYCLSCQSLESQTLYSLLDYSLSALFSFLTTWWTARNREKLCMAINYLNRRNHISLIFREYNRHFLQIVWTLINNILMTSTSYFFV